MPAPVFACLGEKLAVTAGGETRIYDLSSLEGGQVLENPQGYVLGALREGDELTVSLLWPVGQESPEEDKFPEPIALEDVKKLPEGEEVSLTFLWPETPPPSPEAELVAGLVRDLLAADVAVSDAFILQTAAVFEYPGWAAGQRYQKGEIIRSGGLHYRVIAEHVSNEAYPVETTFAYYRLIELRASGTAEDPIPYPETAGVLVNVESGKYYSYKGKIYLAKADMSDCIWPPDTQIWQWEGVE